MPSRPGPATVLLWERGDGRASFRHRDPRGAALPAGPFGLARAAGDQIRLRGGARRFNVGQRGRDWPAATSLIFTPNDREHRNPAWPASPASRDTGPRSSRRERA